VNFCIDYFFHYYSNGAKILILSLILFFSCDLFSQSNPALSTKKDTLVKKEVVVDSFQLKDASGDIKSKIDYKAEDSIVFDNVSKKMFLYNKSKIDYNSMNVDAYYIEYDWNTGVMTANQKVEGDSIVGVPYLKQDGKEYITDKITYNFKSQKGKVYNIVTQEGEGFLHGEEVKKDSNKNWYVSRAKYTTCDLEHPHFHFNARKLKLIPDKAMITGPTNIVINDIPTPLYLPFGLFPLKKGRRSGLLLPTEYGFSPVFNLQGLGYYFGINDHMDLAVRTQLFFNGSYGIQGDFRYLKKYNFNGSFTVGMNRIFQGDNDNPLVSANTATNYNFTWTHSQDIKAHPTFTFNTTMRYQTQGFFQNPINVTARRIDAQINSSLSLTKRFRGLPLELRSSVNYTQNLANKSVTGQFPNLQLNYNGNPFKTATGKGYLNQLNFSYTSEFNSQFRSYDSLLLTKEFFKDLKFGILHSVNFNFGAIKLLKNFNLSPSFRYQNRNYFSRTLFDYSTKLDTITENGFYSVQDFSGGLNLSTVIVGIKQFRGRGFQGIRHQMTPNVGFAFSPDFTKDFWGYYRRLDTGKVITYSPYAQGLYSVPGNSAAAMLNFGLSNSLEAKFFNKKDSANPSKKIMLIDNLSLSGSYNLNAESFKMSNWFMSMSSNIGKFANFRMDFNYDPYVYENGVRVDKLLISNKGGLVRLQSFSAALNFNLSSANLASNVLKSNKGSEAERNYIYRNYHYFYDFNNPWNASFAVNFTSNNDFKLDTTVYSANISMNNLDFNLTKNWKIAIRSGYDFNSKQILMTTISAVRNMHCWEFRFNYTPISNFGQAYSIEIRPKSALLQDLKLMKNKPALENYF